MKKIDLNGKWIFHEVGRGKWFDAVVPGTNFADLVRNDIIPHPYYDANNQLVQWVGERDWEYVREFNLSKDMLQMPVIMLDCKCIDTLAEIYINDRLVGKTDNAFIHYTFDIKNFVSRLTNKIRIKFRSPIAYIERMTEDGAPTGNPLGMAGASLLRKPSNHFGWDNSPCLVLSGITDDISIIAYDDVRIDKVQYSQKFVEGFANIICGVDLTGWVATDERKYRLEMSALQPDGKLLTQTIDKVAEQNELFVTVNTPILWQTHDRLEEGESPALYAVKVQLYCDNKLIDSRTFEVGLRTIEVVRSKSAATRKFEIILNGDPLNIKGAVLTPRDMLKPAFDPERASRLVEGAVDAGLNMLRSFAGDGYADPRLYELCDRAGVLIWQDMPFSSYEYPWQNKDFRAGVAREIASQMQELSTHPSLCLLCGGYEIEQRAKNWKWLGKRVADIKEFLYDFLPKEIAKCATEIGYLPGAPISNKWLNKVNGDKYGVSSMWEIWRGMRSSAKVGKRTPAFCLEFGMPSMPSKKTIAMFCESGDIEKNYFEQLETRQKLVGGVQRMQFYISKQFVVPRSLGDLVYYSQLYQAEYYKQQCEHLRRRMDKCSGYFFSTITQCWPGIDYSAIDYLGNYKALMYKARQFNSPITLSITGKGGDIDVYIINDYADRLVGKVKWSIETFDGDRVALGEYECDVDRRDVAKHHLDLKEFIRLNRKDRLLIVELEDQDGDIITRETKLFVKDKLAMLPDPKLTYEVSVNRGVGYITVKAEKYARYVKITLEDTYEPFSDNYFDMLAGEECTVTIPVGKQPVEDILAKLSVKSVANVERKGNRARDFAVNVGVVMSLKNIRDSIKHLIMK